MKYVVGWFLCMVLFLIAMKFDMPGVAVCFSIASFPFGIKAAGEL